MNTPPQKPHKTNKKSSASEIAQTAVKVFFYTVGGFVFYTTLIIGVAVTIISFFNINNNFIVWLGTGLGFIAVALILNLVTTRIGSGKWKITWPDLSFMGPY